MSETARPFTPITRIKGMNDIMPQAQEVSWDSALWQRIGSVGQGVLESYGYRRIMPPLVEDTALFQRSLGSDTDIVSKEMYSFVDRGDRQLTLRPEGTAGVVRAYIEYNLGHTDPVQRLWYMGPMFRAERPQKGRYRQFYQLGAEFFGVNHPAADVELLGTVWKMCQAWGLSQAVIKLNTVGDKDSRKLYRERLVAHFSPIASELCENCRRRLTSNPMRILDCKEPECQGLINAAPDIVESLSAHAQAHFAQVTAMLAELDVPFTRDRRLVRGLDYYTHTTFEVGAPGLGAQDALMGGGRYNDLVAMLGGPEIPAIGFAVGIERLALLLATGHHIKGPDLYLIPMEGYVVSALRLAAELRSLGPWVLEVDLQGGRLKQQVKRGDRIGARHVLVLGEEEMRTHRGKLKELATAKSQDVELTAQRLHRALLAQRDTYAQ